MGLIAFPAVLLVVASGLAFPVLFFLVVVRPRDVAGGAAASGVGLRLGVFGVHVSH